MSWRKRILLDADVQNQIRQQLPEEYQNRLKDHIFKMRMLLAEFEILVDTDDDLKQQTQNILTPYKSKRNTVALEMDMDGKLVIAIHQGDPLSPFSRHPQKTKTQNAKVPGKDTAKKSAIKENPPKKKRGFIKTAPAISPVKKVSTGSQFVDEGLSSLFGDDIPPPTINEPVERFAPPPKNPPKKVRLRFEDETTKATQSNTTTGKIGSGSLENLLQAEMKKIDQRRPWEDD